LRNHFLIASLKWENLTQVNFAEKFTFQVSPERDTAHLSELFISKRGCFLECFCPGEKSFAQARRYYRPSESSFA